MSERRASLRLRLFSGVLGASLLVSAPLSIVLLLEVRDALYARHVAAARDRLRAAVTAGADLCQQREPAVVRNCLAEVAAVLSLSGVGQPAGVLHCPAPLVRQGDLVLLCEELPGSGAPLQLAVPLQPVRAELAALDAELLLTLAGAVGLLVLLSVVLLERGVLRRLSGVDATLDAIGLAGDGELIPESGDALARLDASVNRLVTRLREERTHTREQIVNLQHSNRLLADQKQTLRETRSDLARSERLAAVGRLAAGVAHEVGNPVSAVIAYAALLREKLAKGSAAAGGGAGEAIGPAAEYAERIEREASRIDRILRDLLDLARPGPPRLEPVDVAQAVAEARGLIEPQPVWSGVVLAIDLPAGLPRVSAEQHYVVQVLVNLLANAAKAGARMVRLTASAASDGSTVLVEVEDDGRGIPPEVLPHLFEPFFTTAAPGEGTGLGLALCYATLERVGGAITARAGAQGGAVFSLQFQASPAGRDPSLTPSLP